MISKVNKESLNHVFEVYNQHKLPTSLTLTDEIKTELSEALNDSDASIIHTKDWSGFILLFPYNKILAMNPWFLNGFPIGDGEQLMDECLQVFKDSKYNTLELISTAPGETSLPYLYNYADMRLTLTPSMNQPSSSELSFIPVSNVDISLLKDQFRLAFSNGDAKFYGLLDHEDQQNFWHYLGYDDSKNNPCSLAVMHDGKLIGFSLVLDYGEHNKHISCMCLDPSYQGKGYGKALMQEIINQALLKNDKSITLGTETHMCAYHLYRRFGFKNTQIKYHYILQK